MTIQEHIQVLVAKKATTEEIYLDLLQKQFTVSAIQSALRNYRQSQFDIQSQGISIIITFGAVSIGLAALSFVAANWSGFGDIGKIMIIGISLIISYIGAWYAMSIHLHKVYTGLLILAQMIFGAGVLLIGEIVSIDIAWQISLLIWGIGILVAVSAFHSKILEWGLILILGISALGIPMFFETYDWYRADYIVYTVISLAISSLLYGYSYIRYRHYDISDYPFN